MQVGASEVVITPPLGVELAGYGPDLSRRSNEIGDQLYAQAIVFEAGGQQVAIVTADLLVLTASFVETVRESIERTTGIPAGNVLIACIHSHTSPTTGGTRGWGSPDEEYVSMLARYLTGAVAWAQRKLEPASLSVGESPYSGLAWNRAGYDVVDERVHVVHARNMDGEVIAALVQHACHPVILGPSQTISADFPGATRAWMKNRLPGAVVAYVNGAAGDIDPVTNRDAWGQGTSEDVSRFGAALADAAFDAIENSRVVEDPRIQVTTKDLNLGFDLPTISDLDEELRKLDHVLASREGAEDQPFGAPSGSDDMPAFWHGYYTSMLERIRSGKQEDHVVAQLQVIALGPEIALLAVPAEVYTEQGIAMKQSSPFGATIPICYANGSVGYLPPRQEFQRGTYTTRLAAAVHDSPPFEEGVAEELLRGSQTLLASGYAAVLGPLDQPPRE